MRRVVIAALLLAAAGPAGARDGLADRTTTSANGVMIHYVVGGSGKPALVFVHGWGSSAAHWREQLPVFARDHVVVALDLAGHGASGDGRVRFTIASLAADVAAVVRKEGLGDLVLVGHTMGCPVALEAVPLLGRKVKLVVGVESLLNVEGGFPEDEYRRLRSAIDTDFRSATHEYAVSQFPRDADPALVAGLAHDVASMRRRVVVSTLEEIRGFDTAAAMEKADAPIVCINSTMTPTAVDANRRHAKSFDVVTIDDVGPFPQLEKPAVFDRVLAGVLAARGLGPAAQ